MGISSIATNVGAYYAQRNIRSASQDSELSIGRLSSGQRIVRAADDVAALSVGTSLTTTVTTLRRALINTSQASTLLQVADGGLANITTILQRQKALAVQANSGSLTASERTFLNQEFQALTNEINRLVDQTNFNGITLLDGSAGQTTATFELNAPGAVADISDAGTYSNALAVNGTSFTTVALGTGNTLVGSFGNFTGVFDFDGGGNTVFQVEINNTVYTSDIHADPIAAATTITFTANNGSSFSFDTGTSDLALASQADADAAAQAFNEAFADVNLYQTVAVTNAAAGANSLNGLLAADLTITSNDIDTSAVAAGTGNAVLGNISEFTVRSVSADNAGDATISVTINGEVYVLDNSNANTVYTNNAFTVGGANELTLVNVNDSNDILTISLANVATDISILTADDAAQLKEDLDAAFGVTTNTTANGGLSFQVGSDVLDQISVEIGDASATVLFGGVNLNLLTEASAVQASRVLDDSIDMVTSLRADVGALQSRFDFAAANVETSIQNQDAARGVLLDTDISDESTAFATSQVLLQAGISVLAQANLLPQNLLKLIG